MVTWRLISVPSAARLRFWFKWKIPRKLQLAVVLPASAAWTEVTPQLLAMSPCTPVLLKAPTQRKGGSGAGEGKDVPKPRVALSLRSLTMLLPSPWGRCSLSHPLPATPAASEAPWDREGSDTPASYRALVCSRLVVCIDLICGHSVCCFSKQMQSSLSLGGLSQKVEVCYKIREHSPLESFAPPASPLLHALGHVFISLVLLSQHIPRLPLLSKHSPNPRLRPELTLENDFIE